MMLFMFTNTLPLLVLVEDKAGSGVSQLTKLFGYAITT